MPVGVEVLQLGSRYCKREGVKFKKEACKACVPFKARKSAETAGKRHKQSKHTVFLTVTACLCAVLGQDTEPLHGNSITINE